MISATNLSILNLIYTTVARPKRFYTPLSARPHATRPLQNTCDSTHTGVQPQRLQVRRPGPRQALNSLSMFHVSLSRFSRTTSGSQGARGGHAINHATHPPRSPKPPSRHTHTKVHCTGTERHTKPPTIHAHIHDDSHRRKRAPGALSSSCFIRPPEAAASAQASASMTRSTSSSFLPPTLSDCAASIDLSVGILSVSSAGLKSLRIVLTSFSTSSGKRSFLR